MTIQEDILTLEQKQKDHFALNGNYLQCIQTPEIIPLKDSKTEFTKLLKPVDENKQLDFIPTEKDYAFRIDVWSKKDGSKGFIITAIRDLGDDIIEIVRKGSVEE